jgi:asparagine synthetase B (glutamine-hydrolysing)
MDLSIAYALYFAARGTGQASAGKNEKPVAYTTPARVLLSGLGADELFGGYTRHATAFERNGFPGLLNELELDVSRLGKRNLGRDDRVISNWGREARYPYLDESLVNWALESPVWSKCGFGTERRSGQEAEEDLEPGKKVLRLLARQLGLSSVAKEKKRAASNPFCRSSVTNASLRFNLGHEQQRWRQVGQKERLTFHEMGQWR